MPRKKIALAAVAEEFTEPAPYLRVYPEPLPGDVLMCRPTQMDSQPYPAIVSGIGRDKTVYVSVLRPRRDVLNVWDALPVHETDPGPAGAPCVFHRVC